MAIDATLVQSWPRLDSNEYIGNRYMHSIHLWLAISLWFLVGKMNLNDGTFYSLLDYKSWLGYQLQMITDDTLHQLHSLASIGNGNDWASDNSKEYLRMELAHSPLSLKSINNWHAQKISSENYSLGYKHETGLHLATSRRNIFTIYI